VGQFLPKVYGVFQLIELHKKDLEKTLKKIDGKSRKGPSKSSSARIKVANAQ
jgi:hypothetical protein